MNEETLEQRAQSQACLSYAESRQSSAEPMRDYAIRWGLVR